MVHVPQAVRGYELGTLACGIKLEPPPGTLTHLVQPGQLPNSGFPAVLHQLGMPALMTVTTNVRALKPRSSSG
jgi:hypothetical protein